VRLWEEFVKEGNKVPAQAEMKGSSQGGASSSRIVSSPHSKYSRVVGRSVIVKLASQTQSINVTQTLRKNGRIRIRLGGGGELYKRNYSKLAMTGMKT